MGNSIYVTMFDKFTITEEGVAAPPKDISLSGRSRRLWTLVAYLILHKDRGVSAQELIDVLWQEDCGESAQHAAEQCQPRENRTGKSRTHGRKATYLQ